MGNQQKVWNTSKGKVNLDKALGLENDELNRAVAKNYVIDADKRKHYKDEPKMTD